MAKRSRKAKRLRLDTSPLLLTKVSPARWADGVALIDVESGPIKGTLALGPHTLGLLMQSAQRGMIDNLAPFNPKQKEATP